MKSAIMLLVFGIPTLATYFQGGRAAGQQVYRDLAYAEPRNPRQMLDVYALAGGSNRPVIFWIHGGGWQRGDKSEMHVKPQAFVEKGFVFATTNYRFIPHVTMQRSEEHTSELQSLAYLVCRLLLEKKKYPQTALLRLLIIH